MRDSYRHKMEGLVADVLTMMHLVRTAVERANRALFEADLDAAQAVISGDEVLDQMYSDLDARCLALLATEQPVAGELRTLVALTRMCADLARMGDLAVHVAKQARLRYPNSSIPTELRAAFAEMGALADAIVAKTATVISTKDVTLGPDIERYDSEMDRLHRELFTVVLSQSWSHGVEAAIDATLLSRYYERYADHAVSIARRVLHVVTGEPYADTTLDEVPPLD